MKIGYARVSTQDQSLDRQLDQLKAVSCDKVFKEKITGTKKERPEFERMIDQLRPGDTVIVTELTRLSRSMKDLIEISDMLQGKGIELKSLKENIDTRTATGRAMFNMMAVIAQFERDLVSQRTHEGLAAARARGRTGGRPKAKEKNIDLAIKLYNDRVYTVDQICEMTKLSRSTIYRYLSQQKSPV